MQWHNKLIKLLYTDIRVFEFRTPIVLQRYPLKNFTLLCYPSSFLPVFFRYNFLIFLCFSIIFSNLVCIIFQLFLLLSLICYISIALATSTPLHNSSSLALFRVSSITARLWLLQLAFSHNYNNFIYCTHNAITAIAIKLLFIMRKFQTVSLIAFNERPQSQRRRFLRLHTSDCIRKDFVLRFHRE